MRGSGSALVAAALALSVALLGAGPARAAEGPRKKVAVLEFRSGVEQERGLGERLASRLRKAAALTVVDAAEARRRSPGVDAEVARCAGEAPCLARIGVSLGVDEVLLVGVSQLGDVVVSLQRIDVVAEAVVGSRLAETLDPGQELGDDKLLEWLKRLYPPEVFRRYGFIAVTASIEGATVTLNGQERGTTPLEGPMRVPAPRTYRVGVVREGYQPFSARIDLLPDARVEVRAEMSTLEGEVAWYKRWYLWAIVGGVVAAAGVGAGVWAATRTDDTHVRGMIQW